MIVHRWRHRALVAAVLVAALAFAGDATAKNTGVPDDPVLQSGPCYEALLDKNATTPTTAPNRELGSACDAEHGDVDRAWARVLRLWGSDATEVPDYDSYRPADAPVDGTAPKWLGVLGILLTYAVLGTPMRSAARLFGAHPGPAGGAAAGALVGLILRGLLCATFVSLFGLPYVGAFVAAALIAWTIIRLTRPSAPPLEPASGSLAAHLAEAINDLWGAAPALAALALFVQQSWVLFATALALTLVVSAGPIIAARRALRSTPLRAGIAAAALAAALGRMLVLASPVAAWLGGLTGASLVVPLAAAGVALASGLALARPAKLVKG